MATANKGAGRPLGSPNKATTEARHAISLFVDQNAHRLTGWLDQVAEGVKVEVLDDKGKPNGFEYVVPPNPAKAFDMFQSVVEYHIPKLARQEHVGDDNKPMVIEHNVDVFGELLKNIRLRRLAEE